MRDNGRIVSLALVVASFVVSAIAYLHMPARVAIHWDLAGNANGFGSRMTAVAIMPIVMLFLWLLLIVAPRHDRRLFIKYSERDSDSTTMQPIYGIIAVVVLALMLAIHVVALTTSMGMIGAGRVPLLMTVVASLGCIVLGNYMPRVTRRNAFIGFRVPWAYASEEVWRRTQRAGGYGMVFGGVVGLVGAVADRSAPLRAFAVATVLQVVVVMIYSYRLAHSAQVP
jgi:uncharacterized membrane protein